MFNKKLKVIIVQSYIITLLLKEYRVDAQTLQNDFGLRDPDTISFNKFSFHFMFKF